ncbi:MAG: hypothetical protein WEB58_17695 [Planctomycetaceae bacterium]
MIYGRVTVLILVMMLFVGIWSSDQPAVRQEYAARHRGEIYVIGGSHPRFPVKRIGVDGQVAPVKRFPAPVRPAAVTSTQFIVPSVAIPGDLSIGSYRVVNDAGTTATVVVTREWLMREHIPANLPAREFYIHQTANECWYWIRLQPFATVRMAAGS